MKIVLVSDDHGHPSILKDIVNKHNDADYYWHLGDSEVFDSDNLKPFISVKGNNDFDSKLKSYKVIEVASYRFLLIHGHHYLNNGLDDLYDVAFSNNCNVCLFGHTHRPFDVLYKNIRFINPGSCFYNRDCKEPSYCILNIDNGELKTNFIEIPSNFNI